MLFDLPNALRKFLLAKNSLRNTPPALRKSKRICIDLQDLNLISFLKSDIPKTVFRFPIYFNPIKRNSKLTSLTN